MDESLLYLFARVEAAVAAVGPPAFLDAVDLATPPRSELEELAGSLGADAYVCDALAEHADVGAALALVGCRVAARVLRTPGDVVSGDDLVDLVEAHRWADVLLAPCLDLVDLAVLRVGYCASCGSSVARCVCVPGGVRCRCRDRRGVR